MKGIKDSKQMTARAREKAFSVIHEAAIAVGIGVERIRAQRGLDLVGEAVAVFILLAIRDAVIVRVHSTGTGARP